MVKVYSTVRKTKKGYKVVTKRKAGTPKKFRDKKRKKKEIKTTKKKALKLEPGKSVVFEGSKGYSKGETAPVIKLEPKKKKTNIKEILFGDPLSHGKEDIRTGIMPIGIAPFGAAKIATGLKIAKKAKDTAVITQTAIKGFGARATSITTQRAFIGKPAVSGINKIFHATRPVAARYATNTKSLGLTQKLLKFAKSPAGIISIIGSYPFAGFIKEEAIQTIGMGFFQASQNNDTEGMEKAIKEQEDILNASTFEKIISAIPYANVLKQLKDFFKAARIKLEIDKGILQKKLTEETDEEKWERIYQEREERRREQRAEDEKYWEEVQESLANAREEKRAEDERYWSEIHEENRKRKEEAAQEDLEEMAWKAEYYNLIREGKYDEAQALLESKLKGGG